MRLSILVLIFLGACHSTLPVLLRQTSECPEGYVPVDLGSGEFRGRAISSGGVVLAIRERSNAEHASLEFWTAVVKKELTEVQGYAVRSSKELQGGRALLFATPRERTTSYYIALYVTPERIVTVEIAGPRSEVEKDLPRLEDFISKLKLG
ncbi:MAG TPA: hypothetical protein VG457_19650 [Planctomycetota bacterium]|jgi:hypothetical protein|nr:hypothetical protein [Planctomycetota bacterium]